MIKKKLLLSLVFYLMISALAFAQNIDGNREPEGADKPNNSRKTIDQSDIYNVDLFTGIGSVSIPIYDYTLHNLDLGVKLNCSLHGNKVDEMASNVGLGWQISSGGLLTRETRGMEDEVNLNSSTAKGAWQIGSQNDPLDEFTADLAGRTLKIRIPRQNQYSIKALTTPKSNIVFNIYEHSNASSPTSAYWVGFLALNDLSDQIGRQENIGYVTFDITDEQGNVFVFIRGDYEHKTTIFNSVYNSPYTLEYYPTHSWVLSKVKTPFGEVNYTYENDTVKYPLYRDQEVFETLTSTEIVKDEIVQYEGKQKLLKKIEYPNGTIVEFNYEGNCSTVPKTLTSIIVSSGYDLLVKNKITYKLNHAYFDANQWTESPYPYTCVTQGLFPQIVNDVALQLNKRLKLNSIDKVGTDNLQTERFYTFDYEQQPLPERLSPSKDIYGYYNGQSPVSVTLPFTVSGIQTTINNLEIPYHLNASGNLNYGTLRHTDENMTKAWALNTVINSSGGKIAFTLQSPYLTNVQQPEPNTNVVFHPKLINIDATDGLVVTAVQTSPSYQSGGSSENDVLTTYDYSDGQRFTPGAFFYMPAIGWIWYSFPTIPSDLFRGSLHGFSSVVIKRINPYTSELLSKDEHTFSNYHVIALFSPADNYFAGNAISFYDPLNYHIDDLITPTARRTISNKLLGLHLLEKSYDAANNLVKKVENKFGNSFHPLGTGSSSRITSQTVTDYVGTAQKETIYNYTYDYTQAWAANKTIGDAFDNIKSISWLDSKGKLIYTNTYYQCDGLTTTPTDPKFLPIKLIEEKWMKDGATDFLLDRSSVSYNGVGIFGIGGISKVSRLIAKDRVTGNGYPYVRNKDYLLHDKQGNVLETKYPLDGRYSANIWDTRIGKKITEVSNAKFADIAQTSFEGGFENYTIADDNKGNWDFDPANIECSIATSFPAITGKYYYHLISGGHLNSKNAMQSGKEYVLSFWATSPPSVAQGTSALPMNLIINSGNWRLYSTTFISDGTPVNISVSSGYKNIDELRLYPIDASMISYTYEPLFGVSSTCDSRNNIQYQEYDKQGRPTIVRDINGNILSQTQHTVQGGDN